MVLAFVEVGIFLVIMAGLFAWNFFRGDDDYVAYRQPRVQVPKRIALKPVNKLERRPYDWAQDGWK